MQPLPFNEAPAVCARVPNSVMCLPSALEVHEIGSRAPVEIWLAIPHKARPPRVSGIRVRLLRFSGAAWAHGVQERRNHSLIQWPFPCQCPVMDSGFLDDSTH